MKTLFKLLHFAEGEAIPFMPAESAGKLFRLFTAREQGNSVIARSRRNRIKSIRPTCLRYLRKSSSQRNFLFKKCTKFPGSCYEVY